METAVEAMNCRRVNVMSKNLSLAAQEHASQNHGVKGE
jgi:hypothetical protein